MRRPGPLVLLFLLLVPTASGLTVQLDAPERVPTDGTPFPANLTVTAEDPVEVKAWLGGEDWQASRTWNGTSFQRSDRYALAIDPTEGPWQGSVWLQANPTSTNADRLARDGLFLGVRARTDEGRDEVTARVRPLDLDPSTWAAAGPHDPVAIRADGDAVARLGHPDTRRAVPVPAEAAVCAERGCQPEQAPRLLRVGPEDAVLAPGQAPAGVLVAEQRACALPHSSTGDRWTATFDDLAAEGACREAPEADAAELHALGERLVRASDRPGRGDLVRDPEGGWLPWRLPRGIDPAPVEPLRVEGPARVFATAEAGLGVLDQALRHAEERVTVTSYLLTSQPVVDRLARTAEAGVDVQLWLEPDPVGGKPAVTEDLVAELEARGVRVHEATGPTDGGLQHAKIVVVDSSLVIVLTENLTEHGLPRGGEANMGLGVAIANATLAARVEQVFREPGEPQAIEPDGWRSIDAPVTVLTSPENAWRDEGVPAWLARTEGPVEGAVLRANPRWGPEANPWLEALARHSQNASVDVLLSGNPEGAARSNREALAHLEAHPDAGALDARLSDPRRGTLHAKTIVTDGALLVGSSNWGLGGALFNREINLLVEDAHLAAEARAIVDGWDEAPAIGSPLPRAVDAIGPAAAIVLAAAAIVLAARLSWPGSAPWRRRRS